MNTWKIMVKLALMIAIFFCASDLRAAATNLLGIRAKVIPTTMMEQAQKPEKETSEPEKEKKRGSEDEKVEKPAEKKKEKPKFRLDVDKFLGFLGGRNEKLDKILGFIIGVKKCIKKVDDKKEEAKDQKEKKALEEKAEKLKKLNQRAERARRKMSEPKDTKAILANIDKVLENEKIDKDTRATLLKIRMLIEGMPKNNPMVETLIKQFVISYRHSNDKAIVATVDEFVTEMAKFTKTDQALRKAQGTERCKRVLEQAETLQQLIKINDRLLNSRSSARKEQLKKASIKAFLSYSIASAKKTEQELEAKLTEKIGKASDKKSMRAKGQKTLKAIRIQIEGCKRVLDSGNLTMENAKKIQQKLMTAFANLDQLKGNVIAKNPVQKKENANPSKTLPAEAKAVETDLE